MIRDCLHLFFPRICPACHGALQHHERVICFTCRVSLPQTGYHLHPDNPIARLFWGRIPIHTAASYYFFKKSGKVQQLLHELKYGNQPEIGEEIGLSYGAELLKSPLFSDADLIIPVPLHAERLASRGYNQSETFANGLARGMRNQAVNDLLIRNLHTESQTKKSRFARWENVQEAYAVIRPERLINKHVLLVDDVITTGATIEACASRLFMAGVAKLTIASIAAPVM